MVPIRLAAAAAYLALITWLAWLTGTTDDGATSSPVAGAVFLLLWLGGAVAVGAIVGPWAFALPTVVAIASSAARQHVDGYGEELAAINVIIQSTIEAVLMCLGLFIRRRRRGRAAPPAGTP